jgi:outer membrane protein assembly factor BamB/tetratricopeptide (TPR) repeat protein
MRRTWGVVVAVGFLAALAFVASDDAQGQVKGGARKAAPAAPGKPPGQPAVVDLADKGRLTLPTDPKLKQKLKAVQDYIDSEDWETVANNVQMLLDLDKDVFVQKPEKGPDGKVAESLVGIRIAANRLVASLARLPASKPGAALNVYKAIHGPNAKTLLAQALADGDKQKFADVAQRFLYTDAGGEAAERLATILLDRGDFMAAAQAFERLIQRDGIEKLEPLTLYKAAIAFHKGNSKEDRDNKDKVWKQLQAKAPDGFSAGGQTVSLDDAAKYLDRIRGGVNTSIHDWPMVQGNPSRSGQGVGDTAFMQPLWRHSLFIEDEREPNKYHATEAKRLIGVGAGGANGAIEQLEGQSKAVLPAALPVTATVVGNDGRPKSVLVFRTYAGIQARDLKTGAQEWNMAHLWSLQAMNAGPVQQYLQQWVMYFNQATKPGVILENSTISTLSSDGGRVYCIDDLAVPPPPQQQFDARWGGMQPPGAGSYPAAVNHGVQGNRLNAIAIASGKLLWSLPPTRPQDDDSFVPKHDFRDSHFLGAPLCLGGKLYILNEKNQEIRLICLDTAKLPEKILDKDVDEAIVWVQPLGSAKDKLTVDYGRRINATHIAYGEGILVCPTNAGVLLGVDLLTHSLLWAHPYSNAPAHDVNNPYGPGGMGLGRRGGMMPGQPGVAPVMSDWMASAPIISDGRVVFTAPDGPELQCLNLRNGTEIWKMKRADEDLYLAGVYAGRVLVVAKKDVRALSLDDGHEVWRVATGLPAGRGVASDNIYYLPLKQATFSDTKKGPGIFAIDVEHGKVVAQTRSKKDLRTGAIEVPGNLLFFDGEVISQTATELVAYPQLKVKLDLMNELLAKNPNDPKGLFERGELRLDKGNSELAGAVADLHAALNNKPPADLIPKARAKLFDAMTELLDRDFNNGEKYLDEYKKLCVVVPARPEEAEEARKETQRRTANFLCLLAQGREQQGKLGEALDGYLEFGSLPTAQGELLSVVTEPAVKAKADVWARGRIKAMMDRATEEQRKPLEGVILGKWNEVKSSGDVEKLRHFVAMFGETAAIGKEGRLYLAERLMQREGKADLLDAETQLLTLANDDDASFVVRALDGLARLNTRKGMLEDAYEYYRRLKDRFADVPVRDGKTGAQLFDELATDRRFLMYMDEVGEPQGKPKFKADEEQGKNFSQQAQHALYTFEPLDAVLPFLKHRRIAVNPQSSHLMVLDRRAGANGKPELDEQLKESFSHFLTGQVVNMNGRAWPGVGMPGMAGNMNQPQAAQFGYHSVGHLVVVNLGQYLVAVDTVTHRVLWDKNLFGAQSPVGPGTQLHYDPTTETLQMLFAGSHIVTIGQAGPVSANYVCLQTRDGLWALDPLTGKPLWTRNDVPMRCRLFGDDKHIYLVELDNNNNATNTRAFRAQDGASVVVPPFAALFQKRQRIIGRELLVADTLPTGGVDLRLYDVQTGKDLWKQHFRAGTIMIASEEPDLAGAIEQDGKITVVNLRQRKVVLVSRITADHMKNLNQAHLLADGQSVYVALYTSNPTTPPQIWSNLQANTGLRGLSVNGAVYAFDHRTGRIRWFNTVENEQLVLEQWRDMPVLLFTSRFFVNPNGMRGFNPNQFGTIGIEAYDKTSGKVLYRQPTQGRPQLNAQQAGQFFAIDNDAHAGKIEMIAPTYKVTITRQGEAVAGGGAPSPTGTKPGAAAPGGSSPTPTPTPPPPRAALKK